MSVRILVVDDEREMAALLARGLRTGGHDVTVAYDGQTSLDPAAQITDSDARPAPVNRLGLGMQE